MVKINNNKKTGTKNTTVVKNVKKNHDPSKENKTGFRNIQLPQQNI